MACGGGEAGAVSLAGARAHLREAVAQRREARRRDFEAAFRVRAFHPRGEHREASAQLLDPLGHGAHAGAVFEEVERRRETIHPPLGAEGEAVGATLERLKQRRAIGRGEFRGLAGRGGAQIRSQIHQRRINLVAHARDDRHTARRHRAHEDGVVEAPQILQAAAAAHHQDEVAAEARFLQCLERAQVFRYAAFALGRGGRDEDVQARRAAVRDAQHILQGRAAQRRHDADAPGELGQCAFGTIEDAFGAKLGF